MVTNVSILERGQCGFLQDSSYVVLFKERNRV